MAKGLKKNIVTVHNKVSKNYRGVHVDGAYGGITPRGFLNLSFYAERTPIPKSTDFQISKDQARIKLNDSADSLTGILREYEFGVYMDIAVAKGIINLLSTKIKELEKIINQDPDATTDNL